MSKTFQQRYGNGAINKPATTIPAAPKVAEIDFDTLYEPTVNIIVTRVRLSESGRHTMLSAFIDGSENMDGAVNYQIRLSPALYDVLKNRAKGSHIVGAVFNPARGSDGELLEPEPSEYTGDDGIKRTTLLVHVVLESGEIVHVASTAKGDAIFASAFGAPVPADGYAI